MPRVAGWKGELLNEVTGFPNSRYNDQADALAQLLANPPLGDEPTALADPLLYSEGRFEGREDIELVEPSP